MLIILNNQDNTLLTIKRGNRILLAVWRELDVAQRVLHRRSSEWMMLAIRDMTIDVLFMAMQAIAPALDGYILDPDRPGESVIIQTAVRMAVH